MFEDEAGFGRINKPKHCWCRKGVRPRVPCHHIREYRYAYGAVDPVSGDGYFLILPNCNTVCMNIFLEHLSKECPDDYIVLVCDGASWHKSGTLKLFPNIELMFIPPYTPEMNPVEQIWKELRARGFHNEVFRTLEKVVDRLCDTINNLTEETIRSITGRNWIYSCFNHDHHFKWWYETALKGLSAGSPKRRCRKPSCLLPLKAACSVYLPSGIPQSDS